jgi:hypothetical protein
MWRRGALGLGVLEYRQRVPNRIAAATMLTLTPVAGRT